MSVDTSRDAVEGLASHHEEDAKHFRFSAPHLADAHADTAATLRALLAERDAALATRDEAIRMMGEASREAGSWRGIAEGKDIVIRQLEAERDAAFRIRDKAIQMIGRQEAECDAARAELSDLLAENDALRFNANLVGVDIAAAFRAGAEAMRERAAEMADTAWGDGFRDAIAALPLPKPEARRDD